MSIRRQSTRKKPASVNATPSVVPAKIAKATKAALSKKAITQPRKKSKTLASDPESGQKIPSKEKLCGPAQDTTLYNELMDEQAALQISVKEWISSYHETPIEAIYQILAAIVKVGGCSIVISREAIQKESPFENCFEELQEGFKDNADVPYLSKTKQGRLAKKRIVDFFQGLMKHGLHDVLNNQTLIGFFNSWFTAMSRSRFRPFRQVGASLALKFMTNLCEACNELEVEQEISLKQTTKRKPKKTAASKKKQQFSPQEVELQITLLSTTLGSMFESIFVERVKDIEATIRAEALKELGSWVLKYPTLFLNDGHLKFLNWRLSDQISSVRLEAINTIRTLCNDDSSATSLRLFISSAKNRLLEMATMDIDLSIRCQTIKLLLIVQKRGLLETDDKNRILNLLFSLDEKTRLAVAPFVDYVLEEEMIPETAKKLKIKVDSLSPPERRKLGLKSLIGLLTESKIEEATDPSTSRTPLLEFSHGLYLAARPSVNLGPVSLAVRALWKDVYYVQDWETMLDFATQDSSATNKKTKIHLSATEEPYLLEMIETSFKILSEEHEHDMSKKSTESSAFSSLRTRLAQDIQPIKDLLAKHGDNEKFVVPVLRSLQVVLDGELFLEADKMKSYIEVAQLVNKIFSTHRSSLVLYHAASTLRALGRFQSGAPQEFTLFSESIVDALIAAITASQDDVDEILLPLHRLHALFSVTSWGLGHVIDDEYGTFTSLLWEIIDKASLLAELKNAVASLGILYRSLLWACIEISDDNVTKVSRLRDKLLHTSLGLLQNDADIFNDEVRGVQIIAFQALNETLWLNQSVPLLRARPPLPALSTVEEACVQFIGVSIARWQEDDREDAGLRYYHNQTFSLFFNSIRSQVFNLSSAVDVMARFGTLGSVCDESIRTLFNHGIKPRLKAASESNTVRLIIQNIGDALTEAIKRQTDSIDLSVDNAANFAKLVAQSLRTVGGNAVRISKALALFHQSTVWTAIESLKVEPNDKSMEKLSLQSFRVLNLLLKGLVVPLHAIDLLRQFKEASQDISPSTSSAEWLPYHTYLKTLEEIQPAQEGQVAPQEPTKRPLEEEELEV